MNVSDLVAQIPHVIPFDLGIKHHFGAGTYIKEMHIPDGHYIVQHKHKYDHLSVLASGKAEVRTDDGVQMIEGPHVLLIPAGTYHLIVAHTDVLWLCVHGTDKTDPESVDEVAIERVETCQQ